MPARSKGARLYERKRAGRASVWVIRDGAVERSLGAIPVRDAEGLLEAYLREKRLRQGALPPEQVSIDDVLSLYASEHAHTASDPARIGYAIDALLSYWGGRPLSEVSGATCRAYVEARGVAASTARRELGTLNAAIQHCYRERHILAAPPVTLPPKAPPKDRWLTEAEAARLLWEARRTPHMARFVLMALYTGTRKDRLLRLRWRPHSEGGWVDLRAGVLHRRAEAESETKKKAPPAKIPPKLMTHLTRWGPDEGWVIGYKGARVLSIKTAWRSLVTRAELPGVTPHTLRHTAITWAMQRGVRLAHAAGYFGISVEELERTYLHHHPDFQSEAVEAMNR